MAAAKELGPRGAGKAARVPARTDSAGDADGARQPVLLLCTADSESAPLVQWKDVEKENLQGFWLRVHKAAWWLTPSYAGAPFRLPSDNGGCPEVQMRVILVQALAKHIKQSVALPDDLRPLAHCCAGRPGPCRGRRRNGTGRSQPAPRGDVGDGGRGEDAAGLRHLHWPWNGLEWIA